MERRPPATRQAWLFGGSIGQTSCGLTSVCPTRSSKTSAATGGAGTSISMPVESCSGPGSTRCPSGQSSQATSTTEPGRWRRGHPGGCSIKSHEVVPSRLVGRCPDGRAAGRPGDHVRRRPRSGCSAPALGQPFGSQTPGRLHAPGNRAAASVLGSMSVQRQLEATLGDLVRKESDVHGPKYGGSSRLEGRRQ